MVKQNLWLKCEIFDVCDEGESPLVNGVVVWNRDVLCFLSNPNIELLEEIIWILWMSTLGMSTTLYVYISIYHRIHNTRTIFWIVLGGKKKKKKGSFIEDASIVILIGFASYETMPCDYKRCSELKRNRQQNGHSHLVHWRRSFQGEGGTLWWIE